MLRVLLVLGGRGCLLLVVSVGAGTWVGSVPGACTVAGIYGTNIWGAATRASAVGVIAGPLALWDAWSALFARVRVARVVNAMVGLEEISINLNKIYN